MLARNGRLGSVHSRGRSWQSHRRSATRLASIEQHGEAGGREEQDDEDAGEHEHADHVGGGVARPAKTVATRIATRHPFRIAFPLMIPATLRATRNTGSTKATPMTIISLKTKS